MEDNFTLFEYVNNKRVQRANITHPINTGRWYRITAEISGEVIKGYLDQGNCCWNTRPSARYMALWASGPKPIRCRILTTWS